ncbi:S24 family peptidase [Stenotrophomonas sp.]|uniref:S24 family peptidase n=1 Tax=Stenotrophomonas sp. TaxID=69392 RepID=UPI0028AD6389|nr:S24 family peptidase [Stenotrophomonas sp.]
MGEEVAKKISEALGHDRGWMGRPRWGDDSDTPQISPAATADGYIRLDLFDGAAGMGLGVANRDYPEVVRTLDVAEWEIRRKLGFLPKPWRIQIITGRGPSMRPKIEDRDTIWIDTSVDCFDGDDYYFINYYGETKIKPLQKQVDGLYVMSINPDFKEWRCNLDDIVIKGNALVHAGFRRLRYLKFNNGQEANTGDMDEKVVSRSSNRRVGYGLLNKSAAQLFCAERRCFY